MTDVPQQPRLRVLVVDDEPLVLEALQGILSKWYELDLASSGEEAIHAAAEQPPDLVVLDLALPGIGGMRVIQSLREWSEVPILILSVRSDEADKIAALGLGADDYLTKPFSAGELLAHVRALLRRTRGGRGKSSQVRTGDLVIDLGTRTVTRGDEVVKLTRIEYAILATLAANADRVITTETLVNSVWGAATDENSRVLRVHMSHLRAKIEDNPSLPRYVVTEPGVGYRFITDGL